MPASDFFAGIDIGSTTTKVALVDDGGRLRSVLQGPTGAEHRRLAHQVMGRALRDAGLGLDEIGHVVATGYGRVNVPFADRQVTELTCHARGVASLFPGARTAIDIGGQDAKCMRIDGFRLTDFVMNDRCAAGTGRFLEMVSETLGLGLDELGTLGLAAKTKVPMSELCTVFVQQEIVAALSAGEPIDEIVAGVNDALAARVASMARRSGITPPVVLTGGVARNQGIVAAMREHLGCEILVPENPFITGALGAALLAREFAAKAREQGGAAAPKVRELRESTFFE